MGKLISKSIKIIVHIYCVIISVIGMLQLLSLLQIDFLSIYLRTIFTQVSLFIILPLLGLFFVVFTNKLDRALGFIYLAIGSFYLLWAVIEIINK